MTNKRIPVKREIKWLYRALLKPECVRVQVAELVGFYNEYEDFRHKVLSSNVAPTMLKNTLPVIKKPQYVQWVEKFLHGDEE